LLKEYLPDSQGVQLVEATWLVAPAGQGEQTKITETSRQDSYRIGKLGEGWKSIERHYGTMPHSNVGRTIVQTGMDSP
jgi:hypothetical protein